MRIIFRNRGLEECYNSQSAAIREWGPDVARSYRIRLSLIDSLTRWEDIASFRSARAHRLHGDRAGQWSIYLVGRWRLILEPKPDIVFILEVSNHYGD